MLLHCMSPLMGANATCRRRAGNVGWL